MQDKKIQRFIKRIFDIVFSVLLLLCSTPLLIAAIIVIKIKSPEAPVIFKQIRIGYQGNPFQIIKLRSMTNECDEHGVLLPDDKRLKRWGYILRRSNIDEIPQVINVLKGEMSLIGPRPVLPCDVWRFNEYQMKRQDALPGITGLEAVNEKNAPTWEKKFEYDIYYVEHFSLLLDTKIFFKTIFIIFLQKRPKEEDRPARFEGNPSGQNDKDRR